MRMFVVFTALSLASWSPASAQTRTPSQWAPSAGVMLGTLSSSDFRSLDTLVESMTGYNSELKGRSWDLCAAHGHSAGGHVRLCYTQVRLDDDSGLFDEFSDARLENVVIKGFKAERMFRFGPRSWPVAPTFSLHGGLGKVTGNVMFTEYDPVFDRRTGEAHRGAPMASERHAAAEYLGFIGKDWTIIGGASIGATATLGPHLTATVGIYGLEMPGIYKGQVQFVYWPH